MKKLFTIAAIAVSMYVVSCGSKEEKKEETSVEAAVQQMTEAVADTAHAVATDTAHAMATPATH